MMLPEPTEVIPTRNPPISPMTLMKAKDFMVGWRPTRWSSIRLWNKSSAGNYDQQQSHRGFDEIVDTRAMEFAQVHQQIHAEVRAGNTPERHRQHYFSTYRAFDQMDDGGGNLGEEVAHGIAADRNDRRNVQSKDEHGQQQYTPAQTRQPDQRSDDEADQHF